MIAHRKMVNVTEPKIVLDLGEEYSLFKDHRVEIIIISGSEIEKPKPESVIMNTAFNQLSGVMRGSVKYISSKFDESDDDDDWEALK